MKEKVKQDRRKKDHSGKGLQVGIRIAKNLNN
jgi:hypothetical protein